MAGPRHPRHYEESFKRQIVQLYENGKPSREIRAEYDISHSTLRRWVQGIRDSGSTRAADNRTPGRHGPFFPRSSPLADFSATAVFRHICCQCTAEAQPPHPLRVFPGMRRRWRWTFQNERRRYSRESSGDTGQRLPLPDIGAMRDAGRSPLRLLLDDRASRDGACGSDRRRRARGPARQP